MMLDKPSIPKRGLMNAEEYKESLREYSPVVYVNGEKIKSMDDLVGYLALYTYPEEKIKLGIIRDSKNITLDVVLGTR